MTVTSTETPWLRGAPAIAAYLGCSERTTLELLRRGTLAGHQPGGKSGTWAVHRDDADAYLGGRSARKNPRKR
jgi:excisionase family DNA binding protein